MPPAEPGADSAASAFGLLQRRVTVAIVALLLGFAGLAWLLTWQQSQAMTMGMSGMAPSAVLFLPMWVSMMVAMMFPTIAPIVLAHRAVAERRGEGPAASVALVLGYLSVWALAGLVPLTIIVAVQSFGLPPGRGVSLVTGVVVIAAGLYQFSTWKGICLRACRHPMGFVLTHNFGGGAQAAFRSGASHGLYCLGCCWALMAVLVLVGVMDLGWMALLSIVFLAEKNWRYGIQLTRVAGTATTLLGIVILAYPGILSQFPGGILVSP